MPRSTADILSEEELIPGDAAMLARIWARADRYACDEGMDLFSSGGSSLDLIHLIADVEDVFGVALGFEDVYGVPSFEELLAMLSARHNHGT